MRAQTHNYDVNKHKRGSTELACGTGVGRVRRQPRPGHAIEDCGLSRPLVVADAFLSRERLEGDLGAGDWPVFSGYAPNPTYEQALAAVRTFRGHSCDSVISVGGGSAIDVAKCVKLWAALPGDGSGRDADNPRFCGLPATFSAIRHVAVPTTAGTGSESTHFAVVYVDGEKRSVAADCLQPDVAVLVPGLLAGLPAYQRKATMLDALCQAVESHWSVASSEASRAYSARAITAIMDSWEAYLAGDAGAARVMHVAANLAGRAINLTTTTLAHAMSYKLTSLYGIAHGHAVALCMPFAWRTLLERGDYVVQGRLQEIAALMTEKEGSSAASGLAEFERALRAVDLRIPDQVQLGDIALLARGVNTQRMGNYPVPLAMGDLEEGYHQTLGI